MSTSLVFLALLKQTRHGLAWAAPPDNISTFSRSLQSLRLTYETLVWWGTKGSHCRDIFHSLTTTAAATRQPSQTKLLMQTVLSASIRRVWSSVFPFLVLSRPFLSQLCCLRCVFRVALQAEWSLLLCVSHIQGLKGLCILTTGPSCEWFLKSCITIMTHCLSFFSSSVDKWLEFQNNPDISKEAFFFSLHINVPLGIGCPDVAVWSVSEPFPHMSNDWQAFVCQSKRMKWEFFFMQ